jgi:hypothetical protein
MGLGLRQFTELLLPLERLLLLLLGLLLELPSAAAAAAEQ